MHFLGEDFDRWDALMEEFVSHRAMCRKIRGGKSGGNLVHFTEMVPRDKLIAYDNKVKKTYPDIYDKYLKPFETQ